MADEDKKRVVVRDISEDFASDCHNRAVQLIEIGSNGSVESDLLIVPDKMLEELRRNAVDLKTTIADYTATLMLQNSEIAEILGGVKRDEKG